MSVVVRFARAFTLRCPRCGARGIQRTWLSLRDRCPSCALAMERGEPDFWLGAYAINLVMGEGAAVLVALTLLLVAWPDSRPATVVGLTLAVLLPVLFYPFSRVIWLAWDLCFRPAEPGDEPPTSRT